MKKLVVFFAISFLLTACGGGGSSSGGSVQRIFAIPGIYEGTLEGTISVNGAQSRDFSGEFRLQVRGTGPSQQVRIAFREFSGTGAIDSNLTFTVPSGQVDFDFFGDGTSCIGEIIYEGQFVDRSVSGTETGSWNCATGETITVNSTFTASLDASSTSKLAELDLFGGTIINR